MYLLLSNIVTILIVYFVYPLGCDCDKLRGTQFEKISFGMPTLLLRRYFFKVWILPTFISEFNIYLVWNNQL